MMGAAAWSGGGWRMSVDFGAPRFDLRVTMAPEHIQWRADRAFQFRRSGFQPIVRYQREHARFAAQPRIAVRLPRILVLYRSGVRIKTGAQCSEKRWHLFGGGDAESGEGLR